jgi:hypothetical protein
MFLQNIDVILDYMSQTNLDVQDREELNYQLVKQSLSSSGC